MKRKYIKLLAIGLAAVQTLGIAACGSEKETETAKAEEEAATVTENKADTTGEGETEDVETVYFAFTTTSVNSYIDENGKPDGYEFAAVKAIFDKLPQYKLEYVPTTDEDLLIGLETGKYDIGVKGAWWTAEREEKFVFPEHYIGTSIIGLTFRTEDSDVIKDIDSFAQSGGKLVPISPQNAQYSIIENYNANHPDAPIELTELDTFGSNDAYQWILEGRYDAYVDILSSFDSRVTAEDGEYHQYAEQLSYVAYEAIPTWAFFNKDDQEIADAFDKAWEEVYEEGTFEELAQKYFGYSLFEYVPEGFQKGDQL